MALERLRTFFARRFPDSVSPGLLRASRVVAVLAIPTVILIFASPLLARPWTFGQHDWDQMNTQREVVVKSILRFHQFPLWDPYECGGHPAWAALESAPVAVSPWLPVYLLAPLPIAIRVEIVASTLGTAIGFWLLASRFTQSVALRALVAVVTINSRFSLQVAAGHSWHLLYGLLPWALYFFDRAIDPATGAARARADVVLAALCLATMVYGDAIYPVPHTAFLLVLYATLYAARTRSWRPIRTVATVGALGVGLSAPKLLPLYVLLKRYPRHIGSEEAIWPEDIVKILTWRIGDLRATTSFTNGMWHEWGLYLGWLGLALLVAGVAFSRGPRERALKWTAFVMVLFVVGGFHQLTPWRIFHLLPLFKSQHVPSRWLYPAVAALACAAASGGERWLAQTGKRRALFEILLGFSAAVVAVDVGLVARVPMAQSFVNPVPSLDGTSPASAGARSTLGDKVQPFHMVHRLPPRDDYRPCLWDIATLPGVLDNIGTLECDTFPGLHTQERDEEGRMPGVGAWGEDDPQYRGEAYVAGGRGAASVIGWTPNAVEVRVEGAEPGDRLVLNQNWDPGWTADGVPSIPYQDAVSSLLATGSQTVRFRYWPPGLGAGLALCGFTLASVLLWLVGRREVGR